MIAARYTLTASRCVYTDVQKVLQVSGREQWSQLLSYVNEKGGLHGLREDACDIFLKTTT